MKLLCGAAEGTEAHNGFRRKHAAIDARSALRRDERVLLTAWQSAFAASLAALLTPLEALHIEV